MLYGWVSGQENYSISALLSTAHTKYVRDVYVLFCTGIADSCFSGVLRRSRHSGSRSNKQELKKISYDEDPS